MTYWLLDQLSPCAPPGHAGVSPTAQLWPKLVPLHSELVPDHKIVLWEWPPPKRLRQWKRLSHEPHSSTLRSNSLKSSWCPFQHAFLRHQHQPLNDNLLVAVLSWNWINFFISQVHWVLFSPPWKSISVNTLSLFLIVNPGLHWCDPPSRCRWAASIRPEPRPAQLRPLQTRPLQPRPLQPRPLQPRPLQPRPLQPRPLQPRPLEFRQLQLLSPVCQKLSPWKPFTASAAYLTYPPDHRGRRLNRPCEGSYHLFRWLE